MPPVAAGALASENIILRQLEPVADVALVSSAKRLEAAAGAETAMAPTSAPNVYTAIESEVRSEVTTAAPPPDRKPADAVSAFLKIALDRVPACTVSGLAGSRVFLSTSADDVKWLISLAQATFPEDTHVSIFAAPKATTLAETLRKRHGLAPPEQRMLGALHQIASGFPWASVGQLRDPESGYIQSFVSFAQDCTRERATALAYIDFVVNAVRGSSTDGLFSVLVLESPGATLLGTPDVRKPLQRTNTASASISYPLSSGDAAIRLELTDAACVCGQSKSSCTCYVIVQATEAVPRRELKRNQPRQNTISTLMQCERDLFVVSHGHGHTAEVAHVSCSSASLPMARITLGYVAHADASNIPTHKVGPKSHGFDTDAIESRYGFPCVADVSLYHAPSCSGESLPLDIVEENMCHNDTVFPHADMWNGQGTLLYGHCRAIDDSPEGVRILDCCGWMMRSAGGDDHYKECFYLGDVGVLNDFCEGRSGTPVRRVHNHSLHSLVVARQQFTMAVVGRRKPIGTFMLLNPANIGLLQARQLLAKNRGPRADVGSCRFVRSIAEASTDREVEIDRRAVQQLVQRKRRMLQELRHGASATSDRSAAPGGAASSGGGTFSCARGALDGRDRDSDEDSSYDDESAISDVHASSARAFDAFVDDDIGGADAGTTDLNVSSPVHAHPTPDAATAAGSAADISGRCCIVS